MEPLPDQICSPDIAALRVRKLGLPADLIGRAAAAAVETPPLALWRRLLALTAAALGVGLCASGIITFVAYNWAALGRLVRVGLIELLLAGAILAAARLYPRISGKLALTLAAVLVGGLLAVFGQTYQTGADPFQLFLLWAALIVPWAAVADFDPLYLLLSLVLGTGVALAWQQLQAHDDLAFVGTLLSLWLLAALAIGGWELRMRRAPGDGARRWLPRTWAALGGAALAVAAGAQLAGVRSDETAFPTLLAVLATVTLTAWRYHTVAIDLFMQTVVCGAVIAIVTCALGRMILHGFHGGIDGLAVLGLIVIGQVGAMVIWLRRAAERARQP